MYHILYFVHSLPLPKRRAQIFIHFPQWIHGGNKVSLTKYHGKFGYKCGERMWIHGFPLQITSKTPRSRLTDYQIERLQYKAEFPMFSKIDVIGSNAKQQLAPDWNFWKYLVDYRGKVLGAWGPQTPVEDIFDVVNTAVEVAETIRDEKKKKEL
uniref:Glutathione peroxidase n=1 Tax=Strigamia maritima TaxID=126957 RepID=T1IZN1_STRMM